MSTEDDLKAVRREFPESVKRAAYERCGGRCEMCGEPVSSPEYDHVVPCAFDGENTLDNCQVLCSSCHREKTRRDIAMIAKSKRIRRKHYGVGRKVKWKRVVPGSKASGWKRKADGTWERRNPERS